MRNPFLLLSVALLLLGQPAGAFIWPNTVEHIEKQLRSSDAQVRREAAARLAGLPPSVVRRLVPKALSDADVEVRLAAVEAALRVPITGANELVVPWLNAPDRRLRLAAAELLRVAPSPRAIPVLGRVLGDPDPEVRVAAAAALGASGHPDASMPLLGHLDDTMPQVQRAVISALARLRDPSAVVPLIGKVQDSRALVRLGVVTALGRLGDVRAASALVLALRDSQDDVKVAALESLGRLQAAEATPSILSLLEEGPKEDVRAAALDALARTGSPEGLDALVDALASDDPTSNESSVREALTQVGAAAIPRLLQCLVGQPDADLADGCALALGEIGAEPAGPAISEAVRRGIVRPHAALRALGVLGDPARLPTVLEYLSDPEPRVRRASIDAAVELLEPHRPDGRAVDPIARALDAAGAGEAERVALVTLLGRTASPRAAKALVPLAEDADNVRLRAAALDALGMLGPSGHDLVMLEALEAEQAGVRLSAAVALRRSASGAAALALLDRLEREAEQDRVATAIALGGALSRARDPRLIERTVALMKRSRDAERDALIEAIGMSSQPLAARRLVAYARGTVAVADRAKVAESLAGHPDAAEELWRLSGDVDGAVRANAIWSLGEVANKAEAGRLAALLADRDVAAAGNAAAALARLASRTSASVAQPLCRTLSDPRSYVRANALFGLAVAGLRCPEAHARTLLVRDPSAIVRRAAARLLQTVPSGDPEADARVLGRCAEEEPDGSVALSCLNAPERVAKETEPVLVYVVPMGEPAPVPRAPFAFVRADGLMRLGITDRRGTLFERYAPRGSVSLEVPAPLAR